MIKEKIIISGEGLNLDYDPVEPMYRDVNENSNYLLEQILAYCLGYDVL